MVKSMCASLAMQSCGFCWALPEGHVLTALPELRQEEQRQEPWEGAGLTVQRGVSRPSAEHRHSKDSAAENHQGQSGPTSPRPGS